GIKNDDRRVRLLPPLQGTRAVSTVLFAACELGLFDLLAEAPGPLDVAAISEGLGARPWGTELLLEACVGLRLPLQGDPRVRGQGEGTGHLWVLPRMLTMSEGDDTFLLLRQGSNQYLRAFGVPAGDLFSAIYRSPAERLQFTRGLQEIWSVDGRRVLTAFDLSPFRTVCDLGGGAGALAQECASLYPGCQVTVFEVPEVVQMVRAHLPLQTEGQVGFREGGCPGDSRGLLEWTLCPLHPHPGGPCAHSSVHHACRPGGGVLVVERVLDADGRGPLATLLGSLNMLLQAEGRERTATQFRALLAAAGFGGFALRRTGGVHDAILATKALPGAGHPGARGQ
uniref:Acetylserotonin O-methyltransferase n=1 Tax=Spermophilus dauricus TaxID=99837 RepID=A0A8C9QCU3_SPEDA